MSKAPRITIGMPAYNSAATIAHALDSLLAQTYTDFELVIGDNASTDDTYDLAMRYARADRRVRVERVAQNIGANLNYTRVARLARGEYFKWASSNDWCAPQFLERCAEALDARPDVVIASPRARIFQLEIGDAVDYGADFEAAQADPLDRLRHAMSRLHLNNVVNGVIRVSALRRTSYVEHYPQSDNVLVAHLAMLGRIVLIDDRLFYRRMEPKTATKLMTPEQVQRHHYPTPTARALFPTWRRVTALYQAVMRTDLTATEKIRALAYVTRAGYWYSKDMAGDIGVAVRYFTATKH